MDSELKPGVYRHYADGRFYLVLFVATSLDYYDVAKDDDVAVLADYDDDTDAYEIYLCRMKDFAKIRQSNYGGLKPLLIARAHADYKADSDDTFAVYVPLYHDKPGRRISVRAVAEFNEKIATPCKVGFADGCTTDPAKGHYVNRFTYLGDVVPNLDDRSIDPLTIRTPEGFINNCSLANGGDEDTCQIYKGQCPDKTNLIRRSREARSK